jgi:Tfp pilus assembly protein PilF
MSSITRIVQLPVLVLTALIAGPALGQDAGAVGCGSLDNAYGPWDYTNPQHRAQRIPIVEQHHLNADVENLIQGQTGSIIADLDYALRAVPNHHRALYAVAKYQQRGGNMEGFRTAECYFDRAMRFKPDDGMVQLIYGVFLQKKGALAEAEKHYRKAVELLPESAEAHYNVGLFYFARKDYVQARKHAEIAYKLQYPLEGLRNKLQRVGEWGTGR